uniref:Uncharacterized protein n=1 Tax=Avena sativa TaxID=4498 RepID=A0ACD5Y7Z4_AVESA
MFSSRSNRLDYQLFFSTRDAFRPLAWNRLVVVVCFSDVLKCMFIWATDWEPTQLWTLSILALATCQCLCPRLDARNPLRRALSLWSPMVAILLLGPSVPYSCDHCDEFFQDHTFTLIRASVTKWIAYLVLLLVVLLATISRMQLPSIIRLADSAIGWKLALWRKTAVNLCMFVAAVMLAAASGGLQTLIISSQACALLIVSFGNLQIPAALLRVVLAAFCLAQSGHYGRDGDKRNLVTSLAIFYVMVLGQGILYIVPCIFQVFSFILRRSLVRRAGFRGEWGVECVDLYYLYAYEKHMEGGILSAKDISIFTFAMESLESDTPKIQLHGVQMLHSFLRKDTIKTMTISKLTNSTKTITSLLKMLGQKSEGHRDTRLFAAKVLAEVAVSLQFSLSLGQFGR